MKYILTSIILLFNFPVVFGQSNKEIVFLETKSKAHLYYVELNGSNGKVFEMGSYLDKAGSGYSIRSTDTLIQQSDGVYIGKNTKVFSENKNLYLETKNKKIKKFMVGPPADLTMVYTNLNNAYYLDNFFSMCDELNKTYTLNNYSFRNGFSFCRELQNKELDHLQFRIFANNRLKDIKDSISSVQNQYVALTNNLIQNIKTIDYTLLKDSLTRLPADFRGTSWYFGTVINEISKHRPDFFFRLAEDLPNNRSVIFMAVEDEKQVLQALRAVENHNEIKKEFFKDRKFGKTMLYKIIGTYAIVIGLITLLIVSQK